jgi:uncharacterized protein
MKPILTYSILAIFGLAISHAAEIPTTIAHLSGKEKSPHIVFVTGDEEYRSEETMPMLARILHRDYGFTVSVCFSQTNDEINPDRLDNIEGLEILEKADMMILNMRFRKLPDEQAKHITDFAESGKPMAGFRTATHAFKYGDGNSLDNEWPQKVLGLPWISHHGHENSTDAGIAEPHADHPILRGVKPFHARSWLYVSNTLLENATPLMIGRAVKGSEPGGEHFSDPHAVAWVHDYKGAKGTSRVFFTTMGHPEDFQQEAMRKLSLNGILWALGLEKDIPADGSKADFATPFEPAESGFGGKFKKGLKPADILK